MTTLTKKATSSSLRWDRSVDTETGKWQAGLTINGKPALKRGQPAQVAGNNWSGIESVTITGDTLDNILELVDNCIDARAKNISIEYKYRSGSNGYIKITDDGDGMSRKDLTSMCILGSSGKESGSGQFGWGVKASFSVLGTVLEVNTSKGGGTSLGIYGLTSSRITEKRAMRDLSVSLKPALEKGLNVLYNGKPVAPFQPEWDGDVLEVLNDKRVGKSWEFSFQCGNAKDKSEAGWYVYKEGRRVASHKRGPNDGDRTMVVVNLVSGSSGRARREHWPLTASNKNSLTNKNDWQYLQNHISTVAKDVMDKSKKAKADKILKSLCSSAANAYQDNLAAVLAGHSGGNKDTPGKSVDPGGTGKISPDPDGDIIVPHRPSGPGRAVPRTPKGPSGGGASSPYSPSANGSKSSPCKVSSGSKLKIDHSDLSLADTSFVVVQRDGVLEITLDESQVVDAKGSGIHAVRALAAAAIIEWENSSGELLSVLSRSLDSSWALRHRRLVHTQTPGWRP